MNDMTIWMGMLGAELVLVLFALLLVYWVRQAAATRRDRQAVVTLVTSAKKNRAQREQQIAVYLKKTFGLDGEAAEPLKKTLVREEFKLLQRFGLIYRNRDAASAGKFAMFVEAALDPYHGVSGATATASAAPPDVAEAGEVDAGELEALKRENKRLSEELSVTMDTMSRMLSEYSTMFSGSGDDGLTTELDPATVGDADNEFTSGATQPVSDGEADPAEEDGAQQAVAEDWSEEDDELEPDTLLVDCSAQSETQPGDEVLEIDERVEQEATSVDDPQDQQWLEDAALPSSTEGAPSDNADSEALLDDEFDSLFDGIEDQDKERSKDQDDGTVAI